MQATVANARRAKGRRNEAEVSPILTFAKARIVHSKKDVKKWCLENGYDYSRISKLINRNRLYPPAPEESAVLASWLSLPADLVFEDAWSVLEKYIQRFVQPKKKGAARRGSTRSGGAG